MDPKRHLRTALLVTVALGSAGAGVAACSSASAGDDGTNDTKPDASTGTDAGGGGDAGVSDAGQVQDTGVVALNSGLIGLWNFDEASGTTFADQSGNNNTGTATGSVTAGATGLLGHAITLDSSGAPEYVTIPDATILRPANITVSVWFNPIDNVTGVHTLVTKPQNPAWTSPYLSWLLRLQANFIYPSGNECDLGSTEAYFPVYGNTTIQLGVWSQTVLTYDGTTISNYVNNTLLATGPFGAADGGIAYSTDPIWIGADPAGGAGEFFHGSIDQMAIWNRVLTSAELTALYNGGSGKTLP